jgi:putative ABC transport system permease protein
MSTGLTRQALRRYRWSFLGPVATQWVAGTVVTMMVTTSGSLAGLDPAARRAVDAADIPAATVVFAVVAVYMSILVVGVTISSAIGAQARDIALLRAVGATPGQVRRSVAVQAAIVAVPAAVLGYLTGLVTGRMWVAALVGHGVLPGAVRFHPDLAVLPLVVGIATGTSVVAGLVAAVRPARVRPATALTETATRRGHGRVLRTVLGLALVTGAVVLAVQLSRAAPDNAADAAFLVLLGLCVGVGLLGPVLLGPAGWLAGPVLRLSRELSGALVPLVLAVAFAAVKVAFHSDAWLESSGTAVYCAFAAVAAVNTLVTVVVGRRRDLAVAQLAGGTRRRVLGVVIWEAVLVAVTGLGAAGGVATATLLPMHIRPQLPAPAVLTGIAATLALVVAGTVGPAAVLTRRRPIDVVQAT